MFTVLQIQDAHSKVESGADFPKYIQDIKALGVEAFETFVADSHTDYFGKNNYKTSSLAVYDTLNISEESNKERFIACIKAHQKGATDYVTFCKDCADNGIEKWIVDLGKMTCIYYDKKGNEILVENIPSV
mgnify:CR=1 FL=1